MLVVAKLQDHGQTPVSEARANSTDPVQTPLAASDQSLYCLLTGISMQNLVKICTRNPHKLQLDSSKLLRWKSLLIKKELNLLSDAILGILIGQKCKAA